MRLLLITTISFVLADPAGEEKTHTPLLLPFHIHKPLDRRSFALISYCFNRMLPWWFEQFERRRSKDSVHPSAGRSVMTEKKKDSGHANFKVVDAAVSTVSSPQAHLLLMIELSSPCYHAATLLLPRVWLHSCAHRHVHAHTFPSFACCVAGFAADTTTECGGRSIVRASMRRALIGQGEPCHTPPTHHCWHNHLRYF